jgi:alpha-D-ribose 1-methylphosphonate 5-triphosphate synthase subunit PhnH
MTALEPVHATQATYRVLLEALARPAVPRALPAWWLRDAPAALGPVLAATCLTLFDADVAVWAQTGMLDAAARAWLTFHTAARLCGDAAEADFAIVNDPAALALDAFAAGTPEEPERSATMLIRLPRLDGGTPVSARGPGIEATVRMAPPLPRGFWEAWRRNAAAYPCGVDAFLLGEDAVIGLPRTLQIEDGR